MGGDFPIFDVPGLQKQRNTVFDCAEEGKAEALGKMVRGSRNFDVDAKDRYGRTILMWGCDKGHVEVVEKCLDLGAKHEIREAVTGRTAVHWAARAGSAEIIQLLVNVGANVLSNDKYGMNPLFLAMQKGEEGQAAVQLLLELGAVHTCVKKHHEILSSMTPEEQEQLHNAEHHTGPTGKTSNTTKPAEAKTSGITKPAEAKTSSIAKTPEVKSPSIAKPIEVKSPSITKPAEVQIQKDFSKDSFLLKAIPKYVPKDVPKDSKV
mmetsp:Transcript_1697/g.2928  ORF Transcript_1697/g.2928 Transcript_1697/m.2928 type:complete len:264 (-) Transcript_1697:244-1035(-)